MIRVARRIGTKLAVSAAIGVLFVVGMIVNTGLNGRSIQTMTGVANERQRAAQDAVRVDHHFQSMQTFTRDARLARTEPEVDTALHDLEKSSGDGFALLDALIERNKDPAVGQTLDKAKELYADYLTGAAELVESQRALVALWSERRRLGAEWDATFGRVLDLIAAQAGDMRAVEARLRDTATAVDLLRVASFASDGERGPDRGAEVGRAAAEARTLLARARTAAPDQAEVTAALDGLAAIVASTAETANKIITTSGEQDVLLGDRLKPIVAQIGAQLDGITETANQAAEREMAATASRISDSTLINAAAGGFVLLVLIGSAVFGELSIARPIRRVGIVLRALADGDKSVEIPYVSRRDEVGDNARAAQAFRDNLERLATLEAEQRAADERAAHERQEAVHRIADSFETAIGAIVDQVSTAASELEAASGSLTQTAETTQHLSISVASASQQASANVESVASATTEMTASVSEIARQVQESTRIAADAVRQAEKTDSRIGELSQAASRIGDVVKLITAIAEQTNLLALNATIEAARAGEAGKGFAVVAQEVKALAAQTGKATGEIGAQIAGMQQATHESVVAIKEIGGTIGRIAEIAAAIAAAVEQQGATTSEVARNIQQVSQSTQDVARTIGEVSHGASATETASEQVRNSAVLLAAEGGKLKDEVRRFLLNVRTGPLDRRETDDPSFTGPERRADRRGAASRAA
ncbi:Methyl-accepting chemotaxis protein 4 [Rhodoplanes serenus]|uniref:Methyl-accepting chemotaxis protein 4 n=2 Tax=Nitrobacteraceae TaxID=41294 RepID=A0A3S4B349_9BRAD|nr:Methyl-accepting chemotaxis protein 4 [Rhodoplanes serenus]